MSEFQRSNEARLQRLNESLMVMEEQVSLAPRELSIVSFTDILFSWHPTSPLYLTMQGVALDV